MTGGGTRVMERALQMRREFDEAFARPVRTDEAQREKFLTIRAGGQTYAIRLSQIDGLFVDKKITPVPGGHVALLGIAGFRGAILPVYDLPCLLGAPSPQTPRWLTIVKAAPVVLAFDAFEAQLVASSDAVVAQAQRPDVSFTRDFLRHPDFSGPILHLPSVLDAIGRSQNGTAFNKERRL
jgi:chemotaxis signal transduction protein